MPSKANKYKSNKSKVILAVGPSLTKFLTHYFWMVLEVDEREIEDKTREDEETCVDSFHSWTINEGRHNKVTGGDEYNNHEDHGYLGEIRKTTFVSAEIRERQVGLNFLTNNKVRHDKVTVVILLCVQRHTC